MLNYLKAFHRMSPGISNMTIALASLTWCSSCCNEGKKFR